MSEKQVKTRIVHKHDIAANWEQAVNFVPKQGELIIYDDRYTNNSGEVIIVADSIKYKIGNGVDSVKNLPFIKDSVLDASDGENSFAQSGYDNKSYAIAGSALGYNTISGSKGYRISAFTPGEKDDAGNYINGTYTLVLDEGEVIPQEIIGSTYCIYLKQTKDSVGTISSINNNIITVDGFLYPNMWDEGKWEKLNEDGTKAKDENGNQIYLTGEEWEAAKAEAYASSYIIFEGLPTIGNINVGTGAHAEGYASIATQVGSHAEGADSKALGKYSHAEGDSTVAYYSAHSEGKYAEAIGYHSHAEGYQTRAEGMDSHAEGRTTKAVGQDSHAEGLSTKAEGLNSHSEGQYTLAQGQASHAEGGTTKALGAYAHAEGYETEASASHTHTEGLRTKATAAASHAEGGNSQATGIRAHAEGLNTIASGDNSHTEGSSTKSEGENSHTEGVSTKASGSNAHAEGSSTVASGINSHAEGSSTKATGSNSHAAGNSTIAAGDHSYAGGLSSEVTTGSYYAFAHGYQAKAAKKGSFALGRDVTTTNDFQTVVGSFNDTSVKNANFVVGAGSSESNRKNSFVSYTDGRAAIGADPKNPLDVATKQYVDSKDDIIVILDVTRDTVIEELQELINAVKGTLVLNFEGASYYSSSIKIPETVHTMYLNGSASYLSVKGPGKSSNTSIFLDTFVGIYATVSGFKSVYNSSHGAVYSISECETVSNCSVVDGFYNCDYVIQSELAYDVDTSGYINISGCKMIVACKVALGVLTPELNIVNCAHINDFDIYIDSSSSSDDFGYNATFRNCDSISDVYLVNDSQYEITVNIQIVKT
jgi:hypothetical protein